MQTIENCIAMQQPDCKCKAIFDVSSQAPARSAQFIAVMVGIGTVQATAQFHWHIVVGVGQALYA